MGIFAKLGANYAPALCRSLCVWTLGCVPVFFETSNYYYKPNNTFTEDATQGNPQNDGGSARSAHLLPMAS